MGPISLYLAEVAARRALTAAYRRDLAAWQAYQAGERAAVLATFPGAHKGSVYCDQTQHLCTVAWRRQRDASEARQDYLEQLWEG